MARKSTRYLVLCCALAAARAVALPSEPLTYEEIVRRELPAVEVLERRAELATTERELALGNGWLREAPLLEGEAGARRVEDGATEPDAAVRFELPLLSGRGAREPLVASLDAASGPVVEGDRLEARLRLRLAYLDAWLGQEILALRVEQIAALEAVLAGVRRRVEAGASAAFETAIVEGELLRARSEADAALALRGEAWAALRSLADLPETPVPVAAPGSPRLAAAAGRLDALDDGALFRAVRGHRDLASAIAEFESSERRSRWTLGGRLAVEGEERVASLSAAYRLPLRAEAAALERERVASIDAARRGADARVNALRTRTRIAVERAVAFGEIPDPATFDPALRAVLARIESGKDRPTEGLLLRRQLLEAKDAAYSRVRDAHALAAEIETLTGRGIEP